MSEEDDAQAAYRTWLVQTHHQASQDFDKAVMTLAGGGLGLSITFIKQIASSSPSHAPVLGVAWVLLAGSLLSILFSYLTSQRGLLASIEEMDTGKKGLAKKHQKRTSGLNRVAALSLVGGVISLAWFALANVD